MRTTKWNRILCGRFLARPQTCFGIRFGYSDPFLDTTRSATDPSRVVCGIIREAVANDKISEDSISGLRDFPTDHPDLDLNQIDE